MYDCQLTFVKRFSAYKSKLKCCGRVSNAFVFETSALYLKTKIQFLNNVPKSLVVVRAYFNPKYIATKSTCPI